MTVTSSGVTHLIGGEEPLVSLAHLAVHVVVVVLVHAVARVRVAVEVVALQYVLGDRSEASHLHPHNSPGFTLTGRSR